VFQQLVYSRSNLEINLDSFKDLLFFSHIEYSYKNTENEFTNIIIINIIILKSIRKRCVNNIKYSILSSGFCYKTLTEKEREVSIRPYRSPA
jgi:hypothetical protein